MSSAAFSYISAGAWVKEQSFHTFPTTGDQITSAELQPREVRPWEMLVKKC